MHDLRISPYTEADNEAALQLEARCAQGHPVALSFVRPTFHARSAVYDNYTILCAKDGEELVGIVAWTVKSVLHHGDRLRAAYYYDLRVDPAYRGRGVAKQLLGAAMDSLGDGVDCHYTLVAGKNDRVIRILDRAYPEAVTIPMTFACLPVIRRRRSPGYRREEVGDVHATYVERRQATFTAEFDESRLLGHVASIRLEEDGETGCSIWTNENLIAETIVSLPGYVRLLASVTRPLRPWLPLLSAASSDGQAIRSWFLFDFFARGPRQTKQLVAAVNELASAQGRMVLYTLVQPDV